MQILTQIIGESLRQAIEEINAAELIDTAEIKCDLAAMKKKDGGGNKDHIKENIAVVDTKQEEKGKTLFKRKCACEKGKREQNVQPVKAKENPTKEKDTGKFIIRAKAEKLIEQLYINLASSQ